MHGGSNVDPYVSPWIEGNSTAKRVTCASHTLTAVEPVFNVKQRVDKG